MKEGLIILGALIIASFLVLTLHPILSGDEPNCLLAKGKLRSYQIYAEVESFEPRAMIYARSKIDDFLATMNGSTCSTEPKAPQSDEFVEVLGEDLSDKAFAHTIAVNFEVFEAGGSESSHEAFGSYCRDGGIGVKAYGYIEVKDEFTGMRGERRFEARGCQQTAYFKMRKLLDKIEEEVRKAFNDSSRGASNTKDFLRKLNSRLKNLMSSLREALEEGIEVKVNYKVDFYPRSDSLEAHMHFSIIMKDERGVFILNGEERRGFWCVRELVLIARLHRGI